MGVELANRESATSWRDFLVDLQERGLTGVEFVVTDDHAGLKQAVREILPRAVWEELMKLEGDRGAGAWFRARHAKGVAATSVSIVNAACDIDIPT